MTLREVLKACELKSLLIIDFEQGDTQPMRSIKEELRGQWDL